MDRAPDPTEAAAIAAAVERFVAETSPPSADPERIGAWHRVALLEGVSAKRAVLDDPRGGSQWLS